MKTAKNRLITFFAAILLGAVAVAIAGSLFIINNRAFSNAITITEHPLNLIVAGGYSNSHVELSFSSSLDRYRLSLVTICISPHCEKEGRAGTKILKRGRLTTEAKYALTDLLDQANEPQYTLERIHALNPDPFSFKEMYYILTIPPDTTTYFLNTDLPPEIRALFSHAGV